LISGGSSSSGREEVLVVEGEMRAWMPHILA
jgi:hypothetical protein